MLKNIDVNSEEFSKRAEEFLKEWEANEKVIKSFINTEEFKNNFQTLKNYLEINKSFGTDGAYYTETPEEITFSKNSIQIFRTIERNNSLEEVPDSDFATFKTSYNGVTMSKTHGQGSFFRFWIDKSNDVDL